MLGEDYIIKFLPTFSPTFAGSFSPAIHRTYDFLTLNNQSYHCCVVKYLSSILRNSRSRLDLLDDVGSEANIFLI